MRRQELVSEQKHRHTVAASVSVEAGPLQSARSESHAATKRMLSAIAGDTWWTIWRREHGQSRQNAASTLQAAIHVGVLVGSALVVALAARQLLARPSPAKLRPRLPAVPWAALAGGGRLAGRSWS